MIDQISKYIIVSKVPYTESREIIKGFFSITHARNFGAAWSIFWNQRILLVIVPIIALLFVAYLAFKEKKLNLYKNIYYGFLIGGIIGNLIDRIALGYVIDFLDFTFFGYDYPIFNVCDVFIVISMILICIDCFIPKKYKNNKKDDTSELEVLDFDE